MIIESTTLRDTLDLLPHEKWRQTRVLTPGPTKPAWRLEQSKPAKPNMLKVSLATLQLDTIIHYAQDKEGVLYGRANPPYRPGTSQALMFGLVYEGMNIREAQKAGLSDQIILMFVADGCLTLEVIDGRRIQSPPPHHPWT